MDEEILCEIHRTSECEKCGAIYYGTVTDCVVCAGWSEEMLEKYWLARRGVPRIAYEEE